jgi:cytochrome c553
MQSMTRSCFVILSLLSAPLVFAKGSPEAGATKVIACTACHGPNGNSVTPLYPTLAGQNAAYVIGQLKHFKSNSRINSAGIMMGMALTLDDQSMEDVAVYFAAQTPTGLEADPSYWQAGQRLYRGGDTTRGIPACMACHGPSGRGNPAAGYPALRAQHAEYVVKQLGDYAAGRRYSTTDKGETSGGANAAIMNTIAQRLAPDDMRNVASYVQGLR